MSPVPMMGVPGCCDCSDDEDDCEAVLTVTVGGPCVGARPIAGATVELYDGATLIDSGTTDASGEVVLGPLSSSAVTYTIETSAVGYISDSDTYVSSGCNPGTKAIGGLTLDGDYHLCCDVDCDLSIAIGDTRTLSGGVSGSMAYNPDSIPTVFADSWEYCATFSASGRLATRLPAPLCTPTLTSGDVPILFAAGCKTCTIWFPCDTFSSFPGPPGTAGSWNALDFDTGDGTVDCGDLFIWITGGPGAGGGINGTGDCPRTVFMRSFPGTLISDSCDPYSATFSWDFDDPTLGDHPLKAIFGSSLTLTVT
jgi:hypothetical protein